LLLDHGLSCVSYLASMSEHQRRPPGLGRREGILDLCC
jgi:hypothetical protein